ncbi:MAG: beta-ketoacyl synthase N-terminal-like domain-containing protein [Candidatus Eiseniibacteriota bacterium]|jgi:3-oxoacyl-(acyl-carrier-protein) synthase
MTRTDQALARGTRELGLPEPLVQLIHDRAARYATELGVERETAEERFRSAAAMARRPSSRDDLVRAETILREIDLRVNDLDPEINIRTRSRIGIFGWGLVGPGVATVDEFHQRLGAGGDDWLEPFNGYGRDNFLVGRPKFDWGDYEEWVLARHEANKFSQLRRKMGNNVLYAVGAFIQALGQNPGLEETLRALGIDTHVYVGTGVGDIPLMYELNLAYYRAQRRWNRFWADPERNEPLRAYLALDARRRSAYREAHDVPPDPADLEPGTDPDAAEAAVERWQAYWAARSEQLERYLAESAAIHDVPIEGDVDKEKVRVIKKRMVDMKRLDARWKIPPPPWTCVSANRIWNIDNIPAAQITMLAGLHGPSFAPIGACSGFDIAVGLGVNAIRENRAKAVVVGMTDPTPHPLLLGAFYDARVISCDAQVSKPLEGLKGTHVSGGANIWILGDLDVMLARGHRPLGCEIVAAGSSSDAYHIITPSSTGPRLAILNALENARVEPERIDTWDLHATATPGDWMELNNTRALIGDRVLFTARKGIFGHGMSVGGGWELTAQHMAMSEGHLFPTLIDRDAMHPAIRERLDQIVTDDERSFEGTLGGKINMGIGGINGVVISKVWSFEPSVRQMAAVLGITVAALREQLAAAGLETTTDADGIERVSHETFRRLVAGGGGA